MSSVFISCRSDSLGASTGCGVGHGAELLPRADIRALQPCVVQCIGEVVVAVRTVEIVAAIECDKEFGHQALAFRDGFVGISLARLSLASCCVRTQL